LVTSHKNPNAISTADVARAYLDPDMAWRDGTPVRVILRPRSESDVALMVSMFPDLGTAMEAARKRPEVPTAATDQDTAEAAERIEGSLVGLSLTQLLLEKRDLRVVPINGRVPTPQSIQSGDYPYIKTLYLLTRTNPDKLVSAFIEFVNSDDCQAYLRNAFVWPVGTR
jgi:phosphate transport system substrate-binding protein